jgi:hypothetical protein
MEPDSPVGSVASATVSKLDVNPWSWEPCDKMFYTGDQYVYRWRMTFLDNGSPNEMFVNAQCRVKAAAEVLMAYSPGVEILDAQQLEVVETIEMGDPIVVDPSFLE